MPKSSRRPRPDAREGHEGGGDRLQDAGAVSSKPAQSVEQRELFLEHSTAPPVPREAEGPILDAPPLSPSPEPELKFITQGPEEPEQVGSASGPLCRAVSSADVASCVGIGPSGKECRLRPGSSSVDVSREVRAGRRRPSMGPRVSCSGIRADRPLRIAPWIPLAPIDPLCLDDSHRGRPKHSQPLEGLLQRGHESSASGPLAPRGAPPVAGRSLRCRRRPAPRSQ